MSGRNLDFDVPTGLAKTLPVLPLRRGVLLPGAVGPFAVGRVKSRAAVNAAPGRLMLVGVQRGQVDDPSPSDLLPVATLARILEVQGGGNGAIGVILQGLCRVHLGEFNSTKPFLSAHYDLLEETWPDSIDGEALLEALRDHLDAAEEEQTVDGQVIKALRQIDRPTLLVDFIAAMLEANDVWRQDVLLTTDVLARGEKVLKRYLAIRERASARQAVEDRVRNEAEGQQREVLLRRQLKAIQDELGEGDEDDFGLLKKKLEAADLPDEVREAVDRELRRASRLQGPSAERSVAIDWLGWIAELPWNVHGGSSVDLSRLEAHLDESHHGLADVKRQVLEHLAVRKLGGNGRADVLLLVGPPGVGKTSIGQAIAEATERKLVRVALGGVRDEAELRGHRRTYVGARPGRLIEGIRRAKTQNPVVLLDEVDKLGRGYQGDPAAALLEILDPEQNHAFVDHYLEVPFDLSKVLFVATANDLSTVPGPLRDRMEVLEIDGYTADEKLAIARKHLLGKAATNAGLEPDDVRMTDEALEAAIDGWTREAGVRQLQRVLGKMFRAAAVKKARDELDGALQVDVDALPGYLGRRKFHDEAHESSTQPGIATGLAWTPMGGDVLYVEASTLPGNGKLTLTGQLGDVMKESARAALTYVLSHSAELGIDADTMAKQDMHIHVPAGGVPKDGPSAGVTMFTAIASLLSHRPIAGDIAMTGEATLRGRVLPVGGIKSKILAAHRKGIKRVILPRRNEADLDDVPEQAKKDMQFILVDEMSEVLQRALLGEVEADAPVEAVVPVVTDTLPEPTPVPLPHA